MTSNQDYKRGTKKPSNDQPWHHTALIGVWEKLHKPKAADQGRTAVPGWEFNGQRVQPATSTIAELCEACRGRRGTFYNLQRRGEAPSVVRPGRQVLTVSDSIRCNEALAAALSTGADR